MQSPLIDTSIAPLPTAITSRLASEVYSIILSNFCIYKHQLMSFSFVCKTWLQLCRHFLFAEVEYRADFARFLASSPHATLTIASHIRKVTLRGYAIGHEGTFDELNSILSLPRITFLYVERIGQQTVIAQLEALPFRSLHQLNLRSIHFSSFSTFTEFLDSFSDLQCLSLDTVSWDKVVNVTTTVASTGSGPGSLPEALPKPSTLKTLFVSFCHNRVLLNWLLYGIISDCTISEHDAVPTRSFCSLTTLSLPDMRPEDADIFGVILATVGETLEHLEIGFLEIGTWIHDLDDGNSDHESCECRQRPLTFFNPLIVMTSLVHSISLAQNKRLKTITINQVTLFQFPSPVRPNTSAESSPAPSSALNSPYRWIPGLISTAKSGSVQTICFKVWLSAENQLNLLPWLDLNAILTDLGVFELAFEISGVGRDRDLVVSWFTKRLAIDSAKTAVEYNFTL
jgi:hypothetical protein